MTDAPLLLDELIARIRLANRSGTLLLLIAEDRHNLEESRDVMLPLLRVAGHVAVRDLGKSDQRSGPVAWVSETRAHPADAFVVAVQPVNELAARALGRRLNGERENLRRLGGPLVLFMTTADERTLREVAPDFFTWIAQGYQLPPPSELRALAKEKGALIEGTATIALPSIDLNLDLTSPPIRFLHLSDIHFRTDATKTYDQNKVLQGLLEKLRQERDGLPLDLIFFSGDLANTAKPDEYRSGIKFLGDLLDTTGVDRDRFFIVPGNHDVDRSVGRWLLRTLASDDLSTAFFIEAQSRSAHERKFSAYREALCEFLGTARPLGLKVGREAVEIVEVRGTKVAVASFNSAWFAVADDDIEKLWLGEANVDHAAERVRAEGGVAIAIALMHHPTAHLAERERSVVEKHLERSFDLVLRGHLHNDKAKSVHTGRGGYVELAAPAAYQGSQWPNGCFVGEIRLPPRTLCVRPYKFGSGADPWTLDPSVFPDDEASNYCHIFSLHARRGEGVIRRTLGTTAVDEILHDVRWRIPRDVDDGLKRIVTADPGTAPAAAQDAISTADTGDILGELESAGGRLSPALRAKLGSRLAHAIPPPPEPALPWGQVAFEALLLRLVAYWSDNRDTWLEDLGQHVSVYQLVAYAFFKRQAGQPLRSGVRVGSETADLVIGPESGAGPGKRVVIQVKSLPDATMMRQIPMFERLMSAADADLGALLWFRPDRPRAELRVELRATTPSRATWVVYL